MGGRVHVGGNGSGQRNMFEIMVPKVSVTGLGDYERNVGYRTGSITFDYETKAPVKRGLMVLHWLYGLTLTGYTSGIKVRRITVASITASPRTAEGKYRTTEETKERATEVYARWGLSLSDAINVFLVKSVEVNGLPFEMRTEAPSYDRIAAHAYKAPLNSDDVAVLPADWYDDDE